MKLLFIFQGEGGKLRRAPSWRKKFRQKDKSKDSGDEAEPAESQQSPQHPRRGNDNSMERRPNENGRTFSQ